MLFLGYCPPFHAIFIIVDCKEPFPKQFSLGKIKETIQTANAIHLFHFGRKTYCKAGSPHEPLC